MGRKSNSSIQEDESLAEEEIFSPKLIFSFFA